MNIGSAYDGVEVGEPDAHGPWTRLSAVPCPTAETGSDPRGGGQDCFGVRLALPHGVAFEAGQSGLVQLKDVAQALFGDAIASLRELPDGHGCNRFGGDEVDHNVRIDNPSDGHRNQPHQNAEPICDRGCKIGATPGIAVPRPHGVMERCRAKPGVGVGSLLPTSRVAQ